MPKDEKAREACLGKIAMALHEFHKAEGELTKENLSVVVGGAMCIVGASLDNKTQEMICNMLAGFLPEGS